MKVMWMYLAAATVVAGCAGDVEDEPMPMPETTAEVRDPMADERDALVAQVRTTIDGYLDVTAAEAAGYSMDPTGTCVSAEMVGLAPEQGAMGIHWLRGDLLGITVMEPRVDGTDAVIDPTMPEVLVYEPQADGSMRLVAGEWMVFQSAWDAVNAAPPSFAGQEFFLMADDPNTEADEAHGFAPHYELHVWSHADNENGVFAEFNPAVTCEHAAAHDAAATGVQQD